MPHDGGINFHNYNIQFLVVFSDHPARIKLKSYIAHSVFYYLPPGILLLIVQGKNLILQNIIQVNSGRVHPVPALSCCYNQIFQSQNHYFHDL